MINDRFYPQLREDDESYYTNKYHDLIKDSVKNNIDKFNFKIKFIESEYVIKVISGGFDGQFERVRTIHIGTEPFGVLSVEKNKKKGCSRIHVWSDGCCDGYNCYLINVPNGAFIQNV